MKDTKVSDIKNISEVSPPKDYLDIWKQISYEVQTKKAQNYKLTEQQKEECFLQLQRRPYYLASIAHKFNVKNIAEVGTAEGLQFYTFAHSLLQNGGHIWSCDIKDVRNTEYKNKFNNTTFVKGDSKILAEQILKEGKKIDLYYIDGAHDYGDVVRDVVNLKPTQSEHPIWVFDDYDERFGCYQDIKRLLKNVDDYKVYRVGNAASGNPNHQVILRKKF